MREHVTHEMIEAARAHDRGSHPLVGWIRVPRRQVARLIAGAAPLIAARERDRIIALAEEREADCLVLETGEPRYEAFADVLRREHREHRI